MRVLITTSSFSAEGFPKGWELVKNPYRRKLTEQEQIELYKRWKPIGVIAGVEPLTEKVIETAKKNGLKVISRCGVGTDTVDLNAAKRLKIPVLTTPDAPVQSVAELTVALLFAACRNIVSQNNGIKSGNWKGSSGVLIGGKTVGIVGCGRIGTAVASILQAAGCQLLGYDPVLKEHRYCNLVSMKELAEKSDVVTLHLPYMPQTHHIINREFLQNMKQESIIINCARGGLLDEEALCQMLSEGKFRAVALDCFEKEPYDGKLKEFDRVILSPHAGSSAKEGRKRMEEEARDNLIQELERRMADEL